MEEIENYSLEKLKSMAFDEICNLERSQRNLAFLNKLITEKSKN